MWDVGGQDKLRPLWRSYTRCTDGIIFVVDSCKEERLEEAKLELLKFCRCAQHAKSGGVPVLVLANKQDLPSAMDSHKLEALLGLKDLGPGVPWHLQATCAVTGDGLEEGLATLQQMIVRKRKAGKSSSAATSKTAVPRKLQRSHSHVY